MKAKTSKLAMAVLALSLTQAASASESPIHKEIDNNSTYWGVGIGSVLGAVIAGPPGAAIGATLGGSIGWGKDQNDALDESLSTLGQRELAFQQNTHALEQKQQSLQASAQEILKLRRANAEQASRLSDLESENSLIEQNTEFLKSLVAHYAQDIYFQSGQSEAPDYAQSRLANLVELLKSHPDLRVTLKGYTDPSGSAKLNAKLAQARVDGIKALLKAEGIEASRITGLAIGEVESLSTTSPEATTLRTQAQPDEDISSFTIADSGSPDINSINIQAHAIAKPKPKNSVLERRVSIELSLDKTVEEQSLASLSVVDQTRTEP